MLVFESLILKPFDKISMLYVFAASAADVSAHKPGSDVVLYGDRDVSYSCHPYVVEAALDFLIISHRGLNPVNTKGPSGTPFPVYELKAE